MRPNPHPARGIIALVALSAVMATSCGSDASGDRVETAATSTFASTTIVLSTTSTMALPPPSLVTGTGPAVLAEPQLSFYNLNPQIEPGATVVIVGTGYPTTRDVLAGYCAAPFELGDIMKQECGPVGGLEADISIEPNGDFTISVALPDHFFYADGRGATEQDCQPDLCVLTVVVTDDNGLNIRAAVPVEFAP